MFVTLAADVAAMSPGTNIGAATPISMQGPMDSTLARKVTNDAAAFARTVAVQRGRNADWAERAVREAVSIDEREALKLGVVDFIAATLPELLAESDGRTWRRGDASHVLSVRGAATDTFDPGFMQRLLAMIADPNIAYILLMLGFYGILFELQNPGAILPGVVGGISLILAFLALSTMPVNTAGVALIVLAIVFFVAETQGRQSWTAGGGGDRRNAARLDDPVPRRRRAPVVGRDPGRDHHHRGFLPSLVAMALRARARRRRHRLRGHAWRTRLGGRAPGHARPRQCARRIVECRE